MQLFLSFNSADRTSVITVQKLLQARGITTFLDRDNLVSGLAWPQALEQALRAVDGVAVFIGCELGGWQKREMWFALDRQVREEKEGRAFPVIPVILQGADLTPGFLFLNTWIDFRGGLDGVFTAEALDAFEQAIKATKPVKRCGDSAGKPQKRGRVYTKNKENYVFGPTTRTIGSIRHDESDFSCAKSDLTDEASYTIKERLLA